MKRLITVFCLFFLIQNQILAQEALWLRYSSISPDGNQIAFSYQDDIYLVDANGGETKAITRNIAHEIKPIWSNDGQSIAFASNRYGNYDVFIYSLVSGEISRLTHYSSDDYPYDFSPDDKHIIFGASRVDDAKNQQFPSSRLPELYSISTDGKKLNQVLSVPAEDAQYSKDGNFIYFHNKKGYENEWRKHHTSSITRDLYEYNVQSKTFRKLTSFNGEDRTPIIAKNQKDLYYLSEASGSFNIHQLDMAVSNLNTQLTKFKNSPIRFLSSSNNNKLCFAYDGYLYTYQPDNETEPTKLKITIHADQKKNVESFKSMTSGASEMVLSPNNKEIAFVVRGNIYVSSTEFATTKQITNTPYEERNISFSKDGRSILYAAEKGESWSLFQTSIERKEEAFFFNSTLLKTTSIYETDEECFQPSFSPDNSEVAFLSERTTLKVINLASKQVRTILESKYNYSYTDGDQWHQWSPDGKYFVVDFNDSNRWSGEIGIIEATGKGQLINITQSGYSDFNGKWAINGNLIMYLSNRYGMRSHGSWGSQSDILGVFLNQKSFNEFTKTKDELVEIDLDKTDDKAEVKKKKKKSDENNNTIEIELDGLEDRKVRLSLHSANLADAIIDSKGENLYYLANFEKGFDLWVYNLKDKNAKMLCKLNGGGGSMQLNKDESKIYLLEGGKIAEINVKDGKKKSIAFKAETYLNVDEERAYIFEHVWRQMLKKFYVTDMHGVNWKMQKDHYSRFLPHINNNYDFTEMLSEMLGELNASHTGSVFRPRIKNADQTASLAFYIDYSYQGNGIRVAKLIKDGPLDRLVDDKINPQDVITAINGIKISSIPHFYSLLNRKAGEKTAIEFKDAKGNEKLSIVKAISLSQLSELRYQQWVQERMEMTEKLSGGTIGYVHVRGMNDASFRQVYSDMLGKHSGKKAIIVDTRFNGGGWLHDDLATLLSGLKYVDFKPRGQHIGSDPHTKWNKPSCIIVSESNYSDAHAFPYVYQTLGIGKVIGMPVPGTMTAVWWETQMNPEIFFGIPQVGSVDLNGNYLENQELQPDILVDNTYAKVLNGVDEQLEAAVKHLLDQIKQ